MKISFLVSYALTQMIKNKKHGPVVYLRKIQPRIILFYLLCELDNNTCISDFKNSTKEDYNREVTGIRRAAQPPNNIFLNYNHNCFIQYFINNTPPQGIRTANLGNMRYICQQRQPPGVYYYASMHDEGLGTPVYSGYRLDVGNVNFQQTPGATTTWIRTPGNLFT